MSVQNATLDTNFDRLEKLGGQHTAWEEVDASDALATAVTLGRLKAMVDGALVAVTERLESTGAAGAAGWASTKGLLTHLLGGRKGAGAAYVRVAGRTTDLPAVRSALASGEVSLAHASVITDRVTTLPRDPELRTALDEAGWYTHVSVQGRVVEMRDDTFVVVFLLENRQCETHTVKS